MPTRAAPANGGRLPAGYATVESVSKWAAEHPQEACSMRAISDTLGLTVTRDVIERAAKAGYVREMSNGYWRSTAGHRVQAG